MLTRTEIFEALLTILNKNERIDYNTLLDRYETITELTIRTAVFLENDYILEGSPVQQAYKQMTTYCLASLSVVTGT